MLKLPNEWSKALQEETEKDYFKELCAFVENEYNSDIIYPPKEDVFNALKYTSLEDVKVVILGQDPYFNEKQAHGLCFSVQHGVDIPPSLRNIYTELETDLGCIRPNNGYLTKWAKQGVLLLNTVLTVRAEKPNSHQGKGWENFTDAIIRKINEQDRPIVYMLWGKPAQSKIKMLNNSKHLILKAPHPSPLSAYRGFFGCKHFSMANDFFKKNDLLPVDWQIENV
jgi:uracil-DNA glycosylase